MIYYSIDDLLTAYDISEATLKKYCKVGKLKSEKQRTSRYNSKIFRYVIPESELNKLEKYKKCELTLNPESQPDYYVNSWREEEENYLAFQVQASRAENVKKIWTADSYREYLQTERYRNKRNAALKRDGFRCQICGTAKNLLAHHISYDHVDEAEQEMS